MEMTMRHVMDGERTLEFEGRLLSEVTTGEPGKDRWTELQLFLTPGGNYVLAGIGRSTVQGERDRHWAQVSEEPRGIIEKLTMYDRDGARYVPKSSLRLLATAAACDTRLAEAFAVDRIA